MRQLVGCCLILLAMVAESGCLKPRLPEEEVPTERIVSVVRKIPKRPEWDELTSKEKEKLIRVVRTDTYNNCSKALAERLQEELLEIKSRNFEVNRDGKMTLRVEKLDKIVSKSDRQHELPPRPKHVGFSDKPSPEPGKKVCQLISEVYAPRSGEAPDGKPVVDVWDSCYVKQSLHTINGSTHFYKKWKKKVNCEPLLGMAEISVINKSGALPGSKNIYELKSGLSIEVFNSMPCYIRKTNPFKYEVDRKTVVFGVVALGTAGTLGAVGLAAGGVASASGTAGLAAGTIGIANAATPLTAAVHVAVVGGAAVVIGVGAAGFKAYEVIKEERL